MKVNNLQLHRLFRFSLFVVTFLVGFADFVHCLFNLLLEIEIVD